MLIMLSCGPNSNKIIKSASAQIDNCDFHYFANVDDFINQSRLRHLAFDRLVFTQKFISTDEDMSTLCDYVRQDLSSVEIVMMIQKGLKESEYIEEIFNKYFDSPMYSLMYVGVSTIKIIVDAIKLPMVDVKARYYSLEKKGSSDAKSSKIGGIQGGKKNKNENTEIQKISQESSESSKNTYDSGKSEDSEVQSKNTDYSPQNTEVNTSNASFVDSGNQNNSDFSFDGLVSDGDNKNISEILGSNSEDLDLSIGDFGVQHSDSGFVGDDELEELEEYSNSKERISKDSDVTKQDSSLNDTVSSNSVIENTPVGMSSEKDKSANVPVSNTNINVSSLIDTSKVNIITGLNGSGVSAYVVNMAIKKSKQGSKVLIIDLDYKNNGILSFLDTVSFYKSGCNKGIENGKIFTDDGIDILSNGYDMGKNYDVKSILSKSLLDKYDLVLVDCPIECLDVIDDDTFCSCNVVLGCISDISKLIETSSKLFDRSIVSFKKEKYISNNVKVANKRILKEDIDMVKSLMLFPNGCWLNNI